MELLKTLGSKLFGLFSSLALSATLILLLALLTWLGTLEQVDSSLYDVTKEYFTSWIVLQDRMPAIGGPIDLPVPIPLPGGATLLAVLFFNLLVGGLLRLRRGKDMIGIFVTHVGILMLILSGLVKWKMSDEGHVTLFEGESSGEFQSYHRLELIVQEFADAGQVLERRVDSASFAHATGSDPVVVPSDSLPFDLEVRHFLKNSRPLPKGPMFEVDVPVEEGVFLNRLDDDIEHERNMPGVHVTVRPKDGSPSLAAWTWSLESAPFVFVTNGRTYSVALRKQRYPMPFEIQLDDFEKVDHPGTRMAKSFSSQVTVTEAGSSRPVLIEMNQPLRTGQFVVYQASWGPSNAGPGDPLFSTLAVMRNPADQYPLYSLIVITVGMFLHFSLKLLGFILHSQPSA